MPDNMTPVAIPSMGYGREMSGVRATVKGVATTVDLMAGMGLKYVHATSKGRKGQMGDLEKSREQVIKKRLRQMFFYVLFFISFFLSSHFVVVFLVVENGVREQGQF